MVRETGQGRSVQERSLEITEGLWGDVLDIKRQQHICYNFVVILSVINELTYLLRVKSWFHTH